MVRLYHQSRFSVMPLSCSSSFTLDLRSTSPSSIPGPPFTRSSKSVLWDVPRTISGASRRSRLDIDDPFHRIDVTSCIDMIGRHVLCIRVCERCLRRLDLLWRSLHLQHLVLAIPYPFPACRSGHCHCLVVRHSGESSVSLASRQRGSSPSDPREISCQRPSGRRARPPRDGGDQVVIRGRAD